MDPNAIQTYDCGDMKLLKTLFVLGVGVDL